MWQPRRRPPCKGSPTRAGQRSGEGRRRRRPGNVPDAGAGHFPASLLYPAAKLYYASTKAEVAAQLGISPATVSRLLTEAKRCGIVRIEVVPRSTDAARVAVCPDAH